MIRRSVVALLFLIPAACTQDKDSLVPARTSGGNTMVTPMAFTPPPKPLRSYDWVPDRTELRCAAESCAPQVGLLFFITGAEKSGNRLNVSYDRCTASLIGADLILSNGHCDHLKDPGYFVIGLGANKQVRQIKKLVFKDFDPQSSLYPDIAIFQLDRPIKGITPLHVSSGPQPNFDRLDGYVINEDGIRDSDGVDVFRIDSINCVVRRHERTFPYDLSETPNLIYGFDCKAIGGNSGSPLFAEGRNDIQAVLQASSDPDLQAAKIRESEKRAPYSFEQHWLILATNIRCVQFAGHRAQSCETVSEQENLRRLGNALQQAIPTELVDAAKYGVDFSSVSFELSAGESTLGQQREVLFLPKCRESGAKIRQVTYPSELVKFDYDEWAEPSAEIVETRYTTANVVQDDGQRATLAAQWSAPFGPLVSPAEHPRQKWGPRFQVDLPLCPR